MVLSVSASYTERPGSQLDSIPIADGVTIFDGALVAISDSGASDGAAINWTDPTGANNFFMGVARVTEAVGVSPAAGEGKTGDALRREEIAIDTSGLILSEISVAGAAATDVGNLVFASDENTFTVTATGGGNAIGSITKHVVGTIVDVKLFSADNFRAAQDI